MLFVSGLRILDYEFIGFMDLRILGYEFYEFTNLRILRVTRLHHTHYM
jgi:hypothetical protein